MATVLEIPLSDVKPATLKAWQSKYPHATLRLETEVARHGIAMNEDQFWAIIAELDWKQFDREAIMAPAIKALSRFNQEDIHLFHELLHQKLYALDGRRFAVQLGSNRYAQQEDAPFFVDDFLYSRCAVVANGRAFYETVLSNPKRMPKEYTFESLLYLPEKAWKLKTGRDDYDYSPETWCETFSNAEGWPGIVPLKERIQKM